MEITLTTILLSITFVVLFVVLIIFYVKERTKNIKYTYPPGPPKRALTGNLHNIKPKQLHKSLWDHRDKYGDLSSYSIFNKQFIVVNSWNVIKKLFIETPLSGALLNRPHQFVGEFILNDDIADQSYSDEWLELRETVHKALVQMIKNSTDVKFAQDEEFVHLKNALKEKIAMKFDPCMILGMSQINSTMMTLNGRRFEYNHDTFKVFSDFDKYATPIIALTGRALLTAMPFLRHFPCGYRSQYKHVMELRKTIFQYFFHDVKTQTDTPDCVVKHLFAAQKINQNITDANICGTIMDWYVAGVRSQKASIFSLVYQLLNYPEVQEKVYAEILDVIGERHVTAEDKDCMPYCEAVIWESLRLTAAAPISVPRVNSEDITIYGYNIPRGTTFIPNVWRMNHDPELWKDPWTFKPERFLDNEGKALPESHPKKQTVITFGMGQRECIGKQFSISRLFLYLVNICQSFEIYNDSITMDGACEDESPSKTETKTESNNERETETKIETETKTDGMKIRADPREYTWDNVMYAPYYEIRLRERKSSSEVQ